MFGANEPKINKDNLNDRVHGAPTASSSYFVGNLTGPQPSQFKRIVGRFAATPQSFGYHSLTGYKSATSIYINKRGVFNEIIFFNCSFNFTN